MEKAICGSEGGSVAGGLEIRHRVLVQLRLPKASTRHQNILPSLGTNIRVLNNQGSATEITLCNSLHSRDLLGVGQKVTSERGWERGGAAGTDLGIWFPFTTTCNPTSRGSSGLL